MKVTITIEDTHQGIYPVMYWQDNGVTDHAFNSLSMLLAAQVAEMIKQSATVGALKVTNSSHFQ